MYELIAVIDWWHWMALGFILLILDLAINTLVIIWFGVAAIVVGAIQWVFPHVPVSWMIGLWALFSLLTLFVWLYALKPRLDRRVMKRLPGIQAIVTRMNESGGQIRLMRPIGGKDLWAAEPLAGVVLGSRVIIESVDHSGTVRVCKAEAAGSSSGSDADTPPPSPDGN